MSIEEQMKNMPEDCKKLYLKFSNLRKQTKDLKQDLVKIVAGKDSNNDKQYQSKQQGKIMNTKDIKDINDVKQNKQEIVKVPSRKMFAKKQNRVKEKKNIEK